MRCHQELVLAEFENVFFKILLGHILYMDAYLGILMVELIKPNSQAKAGAQKRFYLNNRLNAPLNIKENWTIFYAFSLEIHPFWRLKSVKGGGRVVRDAVLWLCFKLPIWSYQGHYLRESKRYLFYLHTTSKNEIQICSNKHEMKSAHFSESNPADRNIISYIKNITRVLMLFIKRYGGKR